MANALDAAKETLWKLKLNAWVQIKDETGTLKIKRDEETLKEESYLDGWCVIKTDRKKSEVDRYRVHNRSKDLSDAEKVFRACKAVNLRCVPCM